MHHRAFDDDYSRRATGSRFLRIVASRYFLLRWCSDQVSVKNVRDDFKERGEIKEEKKKEFVSNSALSIPYKVDNIYLYV